MDGRRVIHERLNFDQLLSYSEPKRVARAKTVRGPPLDVESYEDTVYYIFNFKSFPSTTGKRQKGYIKFFKPKRKKTLDKIECLVDCTCPDFKYRWAWANKQKGSGAVGSNSLNQAWNKAPKITNPTARPGLCKHLIALRDFIYGEYENFDGEGDDASKKLKRIVQRVQKGDAVYTPARDTRGRFASKTIDLNDDPELQEPVQLDVDSGDPFIDQRFTKVECVVRPVKQELNAILEEVDSVDVDPEESEALQILRDMRDSLRVLAAAEEQESAEPPPEEDEAEEVEVEDVPELDPELAQP